jgi:hypothetical protein
MLMRVRTNQEREGKKAGIPSRKIGGTREAGTMTVGKMIIMGLTSMSMAIPILTFPQVIIRLRANAASGILIALPDINRLPETAVVSLPAPG